MKLVFPGGEHPTVMLVPGSNRVGPVAESDDIVARLPSAWRSDMHLTRHGVTLHVPAGADVTINDRTVDGVIALRPGDLVTFAGVAARLVDGRSSAPTSLATPVQASLADSDDVLATTVRPVLPRFMLRGVSPDAFGRTYAIATLTTMGRAPENLLRIDQEGISRNHARITPEGDGLLVEDLGSSNGTWLNGARVTRAQAVHGDELGFDTLRFRVIAPLDGAMPPRADVGATPAKVSRGLWIAAAAAAIVLTTLAIAWFS